MMRPRKKIGLMIADLENVSIDRVIEAEDRVKSVFSDDDNAANNIRRVGTLDFRRSS